MKKETKIIIAVALIIAVLALIGVAVFLNTNTDAKPETKIGAINSAEDLSALVDKIYEGQQTLSSLQTQVIDVADADMVKMYTGLESGASLEFAVVSEPMISSQAYSLVLAKVKAGNSANEIAKQMSENVNTNKWICVSAEKVYATSSGDIVCLVMAKEEMAKPIFESFKTLSGSTEQVYEKSEEEIELPAEMF